MKSGTRAIALAGLCGIVLSWAPMIGAVRYPFRVLSTTVHELAHGLAALLTGGAFRNYVVFSDGSGVAMTAGGWRWVVVPAGYLGVTLFAAGLVQVGKTQRGSKRALLVLGSAMILLTLRYAIPSLFSEHVGAGALTLVSGLLLGGGLLWIGLKATLPVGLFTVHLVAFMAALSALSDLWTLLGLSASRPEVKTDAQAMAELWWLPAPVWATLWGVLSLAITFLVVTRRWGRRGPKTRP